MPRSKRSSSRSHSPKGKRKSSGEKKALQPWPAAMKQACLELRRENPNLKGKELFVQGAKRAHKILGHCK